jgi:hypothetical protein
VKLVYDFYTLTVAFSVTFQRFCCCFIKKTVLLKVVYSIDEQEVDSGSFYSGDTQATGKYPECMVLKQG